MDEPIAIAERMLADGARWLHVVDMDRAFRTGGDNSEVIRRIAELPGATVQLGGLLLSTDDVRRGLDLGAARVMAGTMTLRDPTLMNELLRIAPPPRLGVAID